MSNARIVKYFGVKDPWLGMTLDGEEKCEKEKYATLKTFFSKYRNPIGVEIEVENFNKPAALQHDIDFWDIKNDGSLKIGGAELVSVPLSGRQIDCAIHEASLIFQPQLSKILWSHRCSIHVHVNATSLTLNQLQAFVMLYGLFEDLYFKMVDPSRKGNPYCYPARSINPVNFLKVHHDTKYCALNLAPIKQFGTIEFRHMHGSHDWKLLRRWIQLIVKLHYYVDNLNSSTCVDDVLRIIRDQSFVGAFKNIYGATAVLFSEADILESVVDGAPWAVAIADESFGEN